MALFRKLTKAQEDRDDYHKENKKTIAIIGLDGAGKTTIIKRLLKSEFTLTRPTFGVNIELYKYRSLEFAVYDLGGQTPIRESLWGKFVTSADGLVFVLDSCDKNRFNLASTEFNKALQQNNKAPVLFLSNKIDLPNAALIDEVMKIIDFSALLRMQRKYNITRCSALTGESLFESWDWLTIQLSNDPNLSKNNVKIIGYYYLNENFNEKETIIFGKPKTQANLVELFKKGQDNFLKFLRQMSSYNQAETVIQLEDYQIIAIKINKIIIGLVIGQDDSAARAVQIIKNLSMKIEKLISDKNPFNIKDLITNNYPLDIFIDK